MDKRILIVAGAVAALGLVFFLLPGDDDGTEPSTAAAGVVDPGDKQRAQTSAKPGVNAVAANNVDAEDGAKAWNPGGENEPDADDSQQWYWLQQDLDRMIDDTRPKARKRLGADEFRDGYLESSAKYLELSTDERTKFDAAARLAVESIEDARATMQTAQADTPYDEDDPDSIEQWKDAQATFSDQQAEAAAAFADSLPVRSRTTLMREEALRWVVRLDFGLKHAGRAASK